MIDNFNGIFYLMVFIVHFLGYAFYAFQCVFNTKNFLDKYGVDHTGAIMTRFFGAFFIGSTLMAIEILLVGTEGAWPFFVLIFLQNLSAFFIGIYSIKINKLGVNEKTTIEGIIAPGILTILSTILIYGLSDKIYI
jgi:hypothetical protein|tara:strand:- start:186 stop:593 length:408 start_codon:yes stop_codon:yes gene_type:complete